MSTEGWLSAAVENTCDFLVGMVVFLSMIFVNTPPMDFDTQRKRSNVEEQHVFDFAAEDAALYRRSYRHALVGVDAFERLFAREVS